MRKREKQGAGSGLSSRALKLSTSQKILYGSIVGLTAFSVSALIATSVSRTDSEAATSHIGAELESTGYYLTVTSPDELTIPTLQTTEDGVEQTVSGVVNVTTNTNGYGLYLASTSTTDPSLIHESNSSVKIPTTTATDGSLSMNSWGFSMTGENEAHNFKPIPVSGNDVEIAKVDPSASYIPGTISNNGNGDDYDITFGVKANLTQTAGTYSGNVVFTVLSEANETGTESASISPSIVYLDDDSTTLTIATSLMTTMNYGTVTVTVGGETCSNVSATKNATSGTIIVTCTAPELDAWKSYDVVVNVPKFGKTYEVTNGVSYRYKEESTIYGIANMQDMTSEICAHTATPDAFTAETANSDDKTILANIVTNYDDMVAAGTQGVPQTTLEDARDNNTYIIRKLADGNCWMNQSLRLFLDEEVPLTSEDSDIHFDSTGESRTEWLPPVSSVESSETWDVSIIKPYSMINKSSTVGNLYNWYAATAESIPDTVTSGGVVAPDSVCLKNWKLPTGQMININLVQNTYNIINDYTRLPVNKLKADPFNFYDEGAVGIDGKYAGSYSNAGYWASDTDAKQGDEPFAHNLGFTAQYIATNDKTKRKIGYVIRCVAR